MPPLGETMRASREVVGEVGLRLPPPFLWDPILHNSTSVNIVHIDPRPPNTFGI